MPLARLKGIWIRGHRPVTCEGVKRDLDLAAVSWNEPSKLILRDQQALLDRGSELADAPLTIKQVA